MSATLFILTPVRLISYFDSNRKPYKIFQYAQNKKVKNFKKISSSFQSEPFFRYVTPRNNPPHLGLKL